MFLLISEYNIYQHLLDCELSRIYRNTKAGKYFAECFIVTQSFLRLVTLASYVEGNVGVYAPFGRIFFFPKSTPF